MVGVRTMSARNKKKERGDGEGEKTESRVKRIIPLWGFEGRSGRERED